MRSDFVTHASPFYNNIQGEFSVPQESWAVGDIRTPNWVLLNHLNTFSYSIYVADLHKKMRRHTSTWNLTGFANVKSKNLSCQLTTVMIFMTLMASRQISENYDI